MNLLPFLVIFILPALGFVAGALKTEYLWSIPLVVFVFVPILDFVAGDLKDPEIQRDRKSPLYRWILYFYTVVQVAFVCFAAVKYSQTYHMDQLIHLWADRWALIISTGIITGGLGITIAHELMHKNDRFSVLCAEILLTTVCYGHYLVEHVLGHHSHVATLNDPTSARRGESFYRFFPRTLFGSIKSAWRIEKKRLERIKKTDGTPTGALSYRNKLLWYWSLPWLVVASVTYWDFPVVFFFLAQSFVAITLLEIINYTEHYGLVRKEVQPGRYEKVTAHHSWESKKRVTNHILLNLQLHSDHHIHPTKPYQELVSLESPQLPAGYATMALLALIPPLFKKIMDPLVLAANKAAGS